MIKEAILIFPKGKAAAWGEQVSAEYLKKIRHFFPLSIREIKTSSADRSASEIKRKIEGDAILKFIDRADTVIAFDEKGHRFSGSLEFAKGFQTIIEGGSGRLVLVIGGPFGVDERVLQRARQRWSLSELTMNHHVAKVMALEQIYRALTIIKKIPYHND